VPRVSQQPLGALRPLRFTFHVRRCSYRSPRSLSCVLLCPQGIILSVCLPHTSKMDFAVPEMPVEARARRRPAVKMLSDTVLLACLPRAYSPLALPSAMLPAWSAALPLWAGESWLWIELSVSGEVGEIYPTAVDPLVRSPGGPLSDIIVVDCRAAGAVPETWWPRFEAALEQGGVLFVCGLRDPSLPGRIARNARGLRPAAWEVIEPQEDGTWRLRPDNRAAQKWSDRHLNPPFGLRTWLRQLRRRWMPFRHGLACLPVWRELDR
jgi:hypothetical protein